jgi:hemin uptake protein HemP
MTHIQTKTEPSKPMQIRPAQPEHGGEPVDLDTRELFARRSEIRIAHADAIHRLRITRAGKLILNK